MSVTEKEWYTGYIGFLNLSFHNKTHDMMYIYDKNLNEYLNRKNLRNLKEPDLRYIGENLLK